MSKYKISYDNTEIIGTVIGALIGVFIVVIIGAIPVWAAWSLIAVDMFGAPPMSLWVAIILTAACRCCFGGIGGGGSSN